MEHNLSSPRKRHCKVQPIWEQYLMSTHLNTSTFWVAKYSFRYCKSVTVDLTCDLMRPTQKSNQVDVMYAHRNSAHQSWQGSVCWLLMAAAFWCTKNSSQPPRPLVKQTSWPTKEVANMAALVVWIVREPGSGRSGLQKDTFVKYFLNDVIQVIPDGCREEDVQVTHISLRGVIFTVHNENVPLRRGNVMTTHLKCVNASCCIDPLAVLIRFF